MTKKRGKQKRLTQKDRAAQAARNVRRGRDAAHLWALRHVQQERTAFTAARRKEVALAGRSKRTHATLEFAQRLREVGLNAKAPGKE